VATGRTDATTRRGSRTTLIEAELIDEYRMFVYPAWQGRGRGFFPEGYAVPSLRLVRAASFAGGVTYAAYLPT
jgi:dihydrofolate reductase